MQLHGSYTSPYVRHCRIVLMQQGVAFDFVETDYAASSAGSPAKRVPFLSVDGQLLTDSSVILQYLRRRAEQDFLGEIEEAQLYFLANTALDTAVNLFLLEKDGITPKEAPYLARQATRLQSSLAALHEDALAVEGDGSDAILRIACMLEWALFRRRFTLDPYPKFAQLLAQMQSVPHFKETAPPV